MFYYGAVFLALGSGLFAWRCSQSVKKYSSAVEYASAEEPFFWPRPHYMNLVERLERAERKLTTRQRGLPELQEIGRETHNGRAARAHNVKREARESLPVMLTLYWHTLDTSEFPIRVLIYVFGLGGLLMMVPAVVTFLQVTAATLRFWLKL
jgi:hypothetical protein